MPVTGQKQSYRGRPRIEAPEGRKKTLSVRVSHHLAERLDRAAKAKGQPLSQEAELRLEASFRDQDHADLFRAEVYGSDLAALLELIGAFGVYIGDGCSFANSGGSASPGTWMSDPYAFAQVVTGIETLIEAARPPGSAEPRHDMAKQWSGDHGHHWAW